MSNVPWSTSLLSLANAPSLSIVRRKAIRAPFERQGKPHWLTDAGPAAPVAPQRGYVLPAVEELHPDLPVHLEPRAKAAISSVVKPTTLRKHASSSGSTNV